MRYLFDCRGYDKWRLQDESSLFDCNVLKKRINDTMEMAKQGDVFRLMFRLRGGLARDQYGAYEIPITLLCHCAVSMNRTTFAIYLL